LSLGAAIHEFLSSGLSVGERVYPRKLPQGVTLPAVTYQLIDDVPVSIHDLAQTHPLYTGKRYQESRVQFNCYADGFDQAEALSDELMTVITGAAGPWGDVRVGSVLPALSLDDYDELTQSWRRITDYMIRWTAVPSGS
jgi:hypothetical protein